MPPPPEEDLETFLKRQDPSTLVAVLVELAAADDAVRKRLERLQLADRPDRLAAEFRKTLSAWRRSTRFRGRGEARAYGRMLEGWLDDVERELAPRDPAAALALFEAFVEADTRWFDNADDSDGSIGDAVRAACRQWLRAAARCGPASADWPSRLLRLQQGDQYGAREELLRKADLLLDTPQLRDLVARFVQRMDEAIAAPSDGPGPSYEVFKASAALSLLAEALRDPDVEVRAVLRYSPQPNPLHKRAFVQAYLDNGRPADALVWLQGSWEHLEDTRRNLLADAMARLGRSDESAELLRDVFERTHTVYALMRWLEQLPEASRSAARAHARAVTMQLDAPVEAACLLVELGEPADAEAKLVDGADRVGGAYYGTLLPLADAMRAHVCPRGETVVYRALMGSILDRAYAKAYGHAARYWDRLCAIAHERDLAPLPSHAAFEAEVRARHGRKAVFWTRVEELRGGRGGVRD